MVDRGWGAGSPRAERIALASGVVFVVLAAVAFFIAGGPGNNASEAEILSYFRAHDTAVKWQALLFGLSAGFFVWFGGTLASVLRRTEGDPAGRLPAIIVASVGASTGIYLVGMACWLTVADTLRNPGLFDLGNSAFSLTNFTAATFVFAASVGVLRTGLMQEWFGWLGTALTLLLVVNGVAQALGSSDAVSALGTISFLAFLVWVAVASGLLSWQRQPTLQAGRAGAV